MDFFKTLKNKGIRILFIGAVLFFSCSSDTENVPGETPGPVVPVVKSAAELGPLRAPENVTARDAGISAKIGNSILWLFADTLFSPASVEGTNGHTNTAAIAPVESPLETSEPTDANGAPYQAIPFTYDEIAYNEGTGGPDERIALWPGGIMSTTGGALVLIHKLYVNPGLFNYEHIGVEMADFNVGETTAQRTGTLFGTEDPLFLSPMARDGFVYLYGMIKINGSQGIGVARAMDGKERERSSYETWTGTGWDADLARAATLFTDVPGAVSVSWNAYLNKYIAVHSLALSNRVVIRTADNPEGPWGGPQTLFKGEVPQEGVNYAGEQHPELARQNGRVIFVSYYHPQAGFFKGELRLVKVEFK